MHIGELMEKANAHYQDLFGDDIDSSLEELLDEIDELDEQAIEELYENEKISLGERDAQLVGFEDASAAKARRQLRR